MRFLRLACLVLATTLPVSGAASADDSSLTFDVLFGDNPGGRVPTDLSWAPDGTRLAYLWDDGDGKALWQLDVAGDKRRAVVREGGDGGLELGGYHWSPDGEAMLIESAGDLFLIQAGGEAPRRLTDTAEEESDPKFSPDGRAVAFIRDFDLWVLDLASGEETALTTDGVGNEILNGVTDWVYWEEIWGRDSTGYWWSPDSNRIAYYRFDEEPVGTYPLVDYTAVPYPAVEEQKYPKAGTANPNVLVGVMRVAGAAPREAATLGEDSTVWLDTRHEPGDYLARVEWLPSGERVAVQRLNREQDTLELLSCSAADGSCGLLVKETWPTWVNLRQDLRFLDGGRFLWTSEKSGWRRLYLHDAYGAELAALTPEGWALTSLDGVDEEAGTFIYTAYEGAGLGAKDRQVLRGTFDGDPPEPLTPTEGWNAANVAPATGYWVHTWSDADHPTTRAVLDGSGARVAGLPHTPPPYDPTALPSWRFFEIDGKDGARLPAAMLTPAAGQGEAEAPAIMFHYGGPASQVVANRWGSRGRGLWHKMMAQRGYAVLMVDNPASNYFGKRGEDTVHRRFGEVNLTAQLAGVAYLESTGSVDPGRIGIWGWSGGGTHTLYSTLNSPGTWAAAVSGAPVTDWRLYDTIWTERYLDHPQDNADGYRDSSPVTYAGKLETPLLLVHGTGDDNVHPQNTLAMANELVKSGAPVEMAIYPRQKHGFRGISSRHFYERMTEFFSRYLDSRQGTE